jgi:hypothetical protein
MTVRRFAGNNTAEFVLVEQHNGGVLWLQVNLWFGLLERTVKEI